MGEKSLFPKDRLNMPNNELYEKILACHLSYIPFAKWNFNQLF